MFKKPVSIAGSRVLSIRGHVVSGYAGNKCGVFPLQVLGYEVDVLNSVQISNHMGHKSWRGEILEGKDFDEVFLGLKENNLVNYTHVITGYVGSESFLRRMGDAIKEIKTKDPATIYLCDPVLGDNNVFYVPENLVPIYKELLSLADITTPNTFELERLSGMKINSESDAIEAMHVIHSFGVSVVVLSSLDLGGPELGVYVSVKYADDPERTVWKLVTERLPDRFNGTGDLFSTLFLAFYSLFQCCIPIAMETTVGIMDGILRRTLEREGPGAEMQLIQSLDILQNPPKTARKAVQMKLN